MARVLLVEDHEIIRRMLCDSLKDLGHQADCVQTKAEAEQALTSNTYALVISNIVLPDGAGTEITALASQRGARTLLMTGHADEAETLHIQKVTHLHKPFSMADFEKMVRERLGA